VIVSSVCPENVENMWGRQTRHGNCGIKERILWWLRVALKLLGDQKVATEIALRIFLASPLTEII
jgi:hypothetical protein